MRKNYVSFLLIMIITISGLFAQDSLVAHWSFDTWSGDVFDDDADLSSHGVKYGGQLIDGVLGTALAFDGINDYARIPGGKERPPVILEELGNGSISIWFKADHIPTDNGIAPIFYYGANEQCDFFDAANQGLIIELGHSPIHPGSLSLYFTIWKNGCTFPSFCYDSGSDIPLGVWNHFVAVVGEDYNTGYLNGQEMTGRDYNFGSPSSSQFFEDAVVHEQLWLGKGYWDRTTQHFDGAIDELKIFDEPLSDEAVLHLYMEGNVTHAPSSPADRGRLEINVYPNPVSDVLYYEAGSRDYNLQQISLIDLTGRIINRYTRVSNTGSLDISQFIEGLYYLEFHGNDTPAVKSIVIDR